MLQPEKKRIAYVVKRYPRYSETFIVNEILAHEAAGLDIEIFALRGPEDTHFQDIISRVRAPVTYLPDKLSKTSEFWKVLNDSAAVVPDIWRHLGEFAQVDPREIAHAAALAALLKQRGITHMHAHFATSATTTARMASRFTGIPYSFTAHAKDIFHESVDEADLGAKIRDASSVITVSDFNIDYLSDRFPAHKANIQRIYNGLDLTRFPYQSARDRKPLIVSVGRLVEKKGLEYLVMACDQLRNKGVEFRCVIVGSGDREAMLRDEIARHGLQQQVELIGSRPQREVIEIVQQAAVFAAPCIVGEDGNRDGLPTVLLEAMALGTPCIGTDVTGIPEAVIDNETGFCIAQHDADTLAHRIEILLSDADTRERFALAARKRIEQLFNVERSAHSLRQFFSIDEPVMHRGAA